MTPQYIARRQAAIIAELKRREAQNSLAPFLRAAWPLIEPKHKYVPGYHIDAIADHLEAVIAGEIRNLLINIPPRHAKSTIVSVAFPAWVWTENPEHKFIYGSYSHSLAKRDAVKARSIIQSPWYQQTFKVNWKLADDQNEKTNYVNTMGGFRRSTSIGGAIIGEGGDTLVIDDPHSPRSVRSEIQRERALEWIDTEFFTRVNDPKTVSKIVIMQRLDERDASAHLLAKGDWDHLMLPAEFEPERKIFTSIGWEDPRKEKDEPLWPERFGTPELNKMKADMGSKAWAGQGQQRPAPAEGNIIKRAWLKHFWTKANLPQMQFIALSVDLPFSEEGTFAVFGIWGRIGAKKYLLDMTKGQVGFTEQLTMFKSIVAKWTCPDTNICQAKTLNAKWVEKKANGAALIKTVQDEIDGVVPVEPRGSKELRLEAVAPQFEAGNIILPDPTEFPWVGDYIEELVTFPNALFNDQVDMTSQAISKLSTSIPTDFSPISLTQTSKWKRL